MWVLPWDQALCGGGGGRKLWAVWPWPYQTSLIPPDKHTCAMEGHRPGTCSLPLSKCPFPQQLREEECSPLPQHPVPCRANRPPCPRHLCRVETPSMSHRLTSSQTCKASGDPGPVLISQVGSLCRCLSFSHMQPQTQHAPVCSSPPSEMPFTSGPLAEHLNIHEGLSAPALPGTFSASHFHYWFAPWLPATLAQPLSWQVYLLKPAVQT